MVKIFQKIPKNAILAVSKILKLWEHLKKLFGHPKKMTKFSRENPRSSNYQKDSLIFQKSIYRMHITNTHKFDCWSSKMHLKQGMRPLKI